MDKILLKYSQNKCYLNVCHGCLEVKIQEINSRFLFLGRRRWPLVSISLFVIIFFSLLFFDRQQNHFLLQLLENREDIGFLSATYYKESRSFPNKTLVLLFVANQIFGLKHSILELSFQNGHQLEKVKFRIEPVIKPVPLACQWRPYLAIAQLNEETKQLKLNLGKNAIDVPFRHPFDEKHEVVACFAPLFFYERWQLLILTTQIYSHYGAFMHFYIRSIIKELYDFLKTIKGARVHLWPAIRLSNHSTDSRRFDPNMELESRNQAGAMTDCLLLYKESTEYILFPDTDDLFVPRFGRNYLEEFRTLFSVYSNAGAIIYNGTQVRLEAPMASANYSIDRVLNSLQYVDQSQYVWGKVVARTDRVDSCWIHGSYGVREGYSQVLFSYAQVKTLYLKVQLPTNDNHLLHLRSWTMSASLNKDSTKQSGNIIRESARNRLKDQDFQAIQLKFRKMRERFSKTFATFPEHSIYYPQLERCHLEILPRFTRGGQCLSIEFCRIPRFPGIHCMNAHSDVKTVDHENLVFHFQKNFNLQESHFGCLL